MRQFLTRVTDRRLTVGLFIAFLVLFCLGLVLPQFPLMTADDVAAFAEEWPNLDRVLRFTGLGDVYRSNLMRIVFGVCVLQLLAWLALRSGPVFREALRPRSDAPGHMPIQIRAAGDRRRFEAVVHALRARRFRLRESPDGYWFTTKNRFSQISSLVFHVSFVILLGGAWMLKVSAFRGSVILAEGQSFGGTRAEYLSVSPEGIDEEDLPHVAFTPQRLEPVFSPEGRTVDLVCEARTGEEGDAAKAFTVNQPLQLGDAEVLVHGFGLAPVFTVHQVRSGRELDAACVNLGVWAPGLPEDSFRLFQPEATVHVRFFPDYEEGPNGDYSPTMELLDPAIFARVEPLHESFPAAEGLLRVGEALEFGGYRLTLAELRTWGHFHVSRQSGWLLITGFLVMVVSITLRFFFVRQAISVQLVESAQGDELVVGGRAALFPEGFRHWLETVVSRALESHAASPSTTEGDDGTT